MTRRGYVEIAPGVGVPQEAFNDAPRITWRHIDGPLMSWAGQLHWLTWRERFLLWIGLEVPESIAAKRWSAFRRRTVEAAE